MTKDEWLALEVGDVIHDRKVKRDRTVLSVTRVSGTRGQGANTRTTIHVENIKATRQRIGSDGVERPINTIITSSEDIGGGSRFSFVCGRDRGDDWRDAMKAECDRFGVTGQADFIAKHPGEHLWFMFRGYPCCASCGGCRRRDGDNPRCRGIVTVELR